MCFSSKWYKTREEAREFAKGKIAGKAITVYKTMSEYPDGTLYSAVQQFQYELGMHYYQTGKRKVNKSITNCAGWKVRINSGLHSFDNINLANANLYSNKLIVECRIPKEATYWRYNGYVVSTDLIIVKKLKTTWKN